jgi:hypothetical protein
MSEVPEEFVPESPWDFQQIEGHDLIQVFKDACILAGENGADQTDELKSGLMEVFRVLAWEMDELPMPPEQNDKRTLLIQHVLHRVGDQGNGNRTEAS